MRVAEVERKEGRRRLRGRHGGGGADKRVKK